MGKFNELSSILPCTFEDCRVILGVACEREIKISASSFRENDPLARECLVPSSFLIGADYEVIGEMIERPSVVEYILGQLAMSSVR